MAVTLLTAAARMIAVELIIASVVLTVTEAEVKLLFTTKARLRNGLSTIQAFHPDTSRFIAEHFLSAVSRRCFSIL
jgi:hypothetical protein